MPVPVDSTLPIISGKAWQTNVLTTTNGSWTNSPTSYTYQWSRNGIPISGATANTYIVGAHDEATNISMTVTAINGSGSSSVTSANTFIANIVPIDSLIVAVTTIARNIVPIDSLIVAGGRPTVGQLWPRGMGQQR